MTNEVQAAVSRHLVNALPARSAPFTKDELLNGLNIVLNNFLYGFVCPTLVSPEQWRVVARQAAVFEDVEIKLGALVGRAFDAGFTARDQGFQRNYENSLLRTMVREAHEMILLYCEETNQLPVYRAEPWFQFARVLRNVISHKEGGTLREWPRDLLNRGITSVSWRARAFDTTMVGRRLVFYPPEGLELLKDQIDFVTLRLVPYGVVGHTPVP